MKDTSNRIRSVNYQMNSESWWDNYFRNDWESFEGSKQTKYFMKIILENLPTKIIKEIQNSKEILDWGCALGQGANVLSKRFEKPKIYGLDFSKVAVRKAKNQFPHMSFDTKSLQQLNKKFDTIFNSNCLEHFSDPIYILKQHLEYAKKYYILMTPYLEYPRHKNHKVTLFKYSYPKKIGNFNRIFTRIIDTSSSVYWPGKQILVIYANLESSKIKNKITQQENIPESSILEEMLKENIELKNMISEIGYQIQKIETEYSNVMNSNYFKLWQFYCKFRDSIHGK